MPPCWKTDHHKSTTAVKLSAPSPAFPSRPLLPPARLSVDANCCDAQAAKPPSVSDLIPGAGLFKGSAHRHPSSPSFLKRKSASSACKGNADNGGGGGSSGSKKRRRSAAAGDGGDSGGGVGGGGGGGGGIGGGSGGGGGSSSGGAGGWGLLEKMQRQGLAHAVCSSDICPAWGELGPASTAGAGSGRGETEAGIEVVREEWLVRCLLEQVGRIPSPHVSFSPFPPLPPPSRLSCLWKWLHEKKYELFRSCMLKSTRKVRKYASKVVLSRMKLTFHATRQTLHGAWRLVKAMSAWSLKTRHAPSRHVRDARV